MSKKEIIERCIDAYTEAIEVCSKLGITEAKEWLSERVLHIGVCIYVLTRLNKNIYTEYWVKRNNDYGVNYWHIQPNYCDTHEKIMQSLKTRLEILNKELLIND